MFDARFVENKREASELAEKEGRKLKSEDYLYQYADIKFNCVMTYQGMSMIVEIQWMLKFMNDMSRITSIAKNAQEQFMFLVHSNKDDSKGVESLAQFLMSYKDEIDLVKFDAKRNECLALYISIG